MKKSRLLALVLFTLVFVGIGYGYVRTDLKTSENISISEDITKKIKVNI